jgi:aminoglycoside phosphotransferase (APT) family kinase protein
VIRQADLQHFIATIGAALSGPIMADLQSDSTKGVARALLEMLDRLSSDLVDGEALAVPVLAGLNAAQVESVTITGTEAPDVAAAPTLEALDQRLLTLQDALGEAPRFDALVAALAQGDATSRDWLRQVSLLLTDLNDRMEASFAAQAKRPSISLGGNDPEALRERFVAYLHHRYPSLPAEPLTAFRLVPGGNSKLTALVSLAPNDVLPEHVALRVDIANSITGAQLVEEYPILERVFGLGLPVPEPLLLETDPKWLGGAFLLATQICDALFAGSPFPEDRKRDGSTMGPEFGIEAATILARLHSGTLEPAGEKAGLTAALHAQIATLIAEWRTFEKPPFSVVLDLGVAWMTAHPLPLGRPTCLIHGDFAPHNFLTRDGHVAALLDWELSKRGDPSEDLSQVKMMMLEGVIAWDDFVDAYIAAGGPPAACDPHAVAYYQLLSYLKHGVNQTRLRNRFLRGERTDLSAAMVASHYQDRITLYQTRALEAATALGL